MADYYPLLLRAVEGLPDSAADRRREVYERAREALVAQLRSLDPPLSESDIIRERLALDDAVDRIEAAIAGTSAPEPRAFTVPRAPPPPPDWPEALPPEAAPPSPGGATLPPPHGARQDRADRFGQPEPAAEVAQRERPRVETIAPRLSTAGRGRSIVLGLVLFLVIGAIAVAAWMLRDRPADLPNQPVVAEAEPAPEGSRKFADRVAGSERPAAAPASQAAAPGIASQPRGEVAVAQRAVLYEENAANPSVPKATPGRALWRLDAINAGQGQPLETAVRATIEFPEAGLTLNMLLRRNLDATLPASHTIELAFATGGDPGRVVRDVGLLALKNEESVPGARVSGLSVPVKENLSLIGLSNLPSDIERNEDLLLKRNWIDLPVRFASGQRAILSFEKGASGDQVLAEAFRQWNGSSQGASR